VGVRRVRFEAVAPQPTTPGAVSVPGLHDATWTEDDETADTVSLRFRHEPVGIGDRGAKRGDSIPGDELWNDNREHEWIVA
jgi:hypothetical protein